MAGFGGCRGRRRASYWGALAGALVIIASLLAPGAAGAQDDPSAGDPGYCTALGDVLDNGYRLPADDEDFAEQLAEGTRLMAELREVAPPDLVDELDALEEFSAVARSEVTAAGGIAGLTDAQRASLIDRSLAVLEPLDEFYGSSCPGANISAVLYPECQVEGESLPPTLAVFNFSSQAVQVEAREDRYTVDPDDFDAREVPADLQPDEVLIAGVAGLVEVGSCEDFVGAVDDDGFHDYFTATFVPGCPELSPPQPPRLVIGLTPEGQASLDQALEEAPGPFSIPFDIDDYSATARFPGGLNLVLPADASVPEVSLDGIELVVAIDEPSCDQVDGEPTPASTPESSGGAPVPSSGDRPETAVAGTAAQPLSPKFTG